MDNHATLHRPSDPACAGCSWGFKQRGPCVLVQRERRRRKRTVKMPDKTRVCVIGAGIVGLSTALRIQEESRGWGVGEVEVTVVADRYTPNTTSDGSGGFWEPYNLGDTPVQLIRKWGDATRHHMQTLALSPHTAGEVGAQFVSGFELQVSQSTQENPYGDSMLGFRRATARELSLFPAARSGNFFTTVQINVQKYLPWLLQRLRNAGGKTEVRTVDNLAQVARDYDVVVNCGGHRAGQLTSDTHTLPIRGQIRRIHAPWVKHFYLLNWEDGTFTYILPVGEEVVVGGTAQRHSWKVEVDPTDSDVIWKKATNAFPFLKVVHNYGHGGSGVTLHWGCAADAATLVHQALLHTLKTTPSKL